MKYYPELLLFLFATVCSFAHEHDSEAAKSLDAWASVPVITHWGNAAVYVHAFFMSLATLVLLPAGKYHDRNLASPCTVYFLGSNQAPQE